MPNPSWQESFKTQVRVMQTIVAALTVGVLTFAVMAFGINATRPPANPPEAMLPVYVSPIAVLLTFLVIFVLQAILARRALGEAATILQNASQDGADDRPTKDLVESTEVVGCLLQHFQIRLFLTAAISEGMAFFLLILYFTQARFVDLAASLILAVFLAMQLPTQRRVAEWLQSQMESLRAGQAFGNH